MKFYTSYYANFKNIPITHMCIGISSFCPNGFLNDNGTSVYKNFLWNKGNFLSPSRELLFDKKSGFINEDAYERRYVEELTNKFSKIIDPLTNKPYESFKDWVDTLIEEFDDYDAITFLCYEAPDKFCHRHILSKFLTNVCNIQCYEIEVNNKIDNNTKQNKGIMSNSLF